MKLDMYIRDIPTCCALKLIISGFMVGVNVGAVVGLVVGA